MPVLREEISVYPETLFDAADRQHSERLWMVLYTRARQEKAICRELLCQKVPFYLPLIARTLHYKRRTVSSFMPLLPGYVFLFASENERLCALRTNRVSRVLPVDDAEQLVHDLCQIRQLIASKAPLTVESRLAPGRCVRVRRGPLAGIEGTILLRRGETRLLVAVNFLQQGASIEIDDFLLEPIE